MYTQTYSFGRGAGDTGVFGRRARLQFAGGLLIFLGVGHGALVARSGGDVLRRWVHGGLVDSVGLGLGESAPPTTTQLRDRLYFWSGVGGFAAPTAIVGALAIRAGNRGDELPAWLGPALVAWSGSAAALMPRAPWPLAVVSGGLITSAAAGPGSQRG